MYAPEQGMTAKYIATMYGKMNYWSSDVAFIQGIHDYNDVYARIQRVQVNVLVYRSIHRKLKSYESNCIVSYLLKIQMDFRS